MKSLVDPSHAKSVNAVFTPSRAEVARAQKIVAAFEKARAAGKERAKVGGALIEVPIYAALSGCSGHSGVADRRGEEYEAQRNFSEASVRPRPLSAQARVAPSAK